MLVASESMTRMVESAMPLTLWSLGGLMVEWMDSSARKVLK